MLAILISPMEEKQNQPLISDNEYQSLYEYQQTLETFHKHLAARKTLPSLGQHPILKAFFGSRVRILQAQCGRSAGKTFIICYMAWRFASLNPNTLVYIICPQIRQGKKIYWMPKRLQMFGPREFLLDGDAGIRESETRIVFKNGSTIIVDGCENYDALRGIKPDLVFYDEFQHHTPFFDEEVMQPNLSGGKVQLAVFGTPPKRHCYYSEFQETVRNKVAAGDATYFYTELPSWINPTLDPEWFVQKKADLIAKGKFSLWLREYEGKNATDTEGAILITYKKDKHVKPLSWILDKLKDQWSYLQWYAVFDPGTASCFAALFIAHNPYTRDTYVVDEIYETIRENCTAGKIYSRAKDIMAKYCKPQEWLKVYDEAGTWFANEVNDGLMPTQKHKANQSAIAEDGRPGESVLMSLFASSKLILADHLGETVQQKGLLWELENYVKDEKGNYPTTWDHAVDCLARGTLVDTVSGPVPIEDLVGKKGWVHSVDGLDFFDHCQMTHESEPLFEVEFDNGSKVRATANHQFLLDTGQWKELHMLRPHDKIALSTSYLKGAKHVRRDCNFNSSKVQRPRLLSLWKIFQLAKAYKERLFSSTSRRLGIPQRANSKRQMCSSFRWKSGQQLNRKLNLNGLRGTQHLAHAKRCGAQRKDEATSLPEARCLSGCVKSLEENARRESLAQTTCQGMCRSLEDGHKDTSSLCFLRRAVRWLSAQAKRMLLPILLEESKEIQKNRYPTYTTKVISITPSGTGKTYCMRLRRSHAFSVNGGVVVHNCLFYFVNHALPSIDESIPKVPYKEEWEDDIQKRDTFESLFREQKQKNDFTEQIQEDFFDYEEEMLEWIN